MTFKSPTTPISVQTLLEKFSAELSLLKGDPKTSITAIGHPDSATERELIVISDKEHLEKAQRSSSRIWLLPPNLGANQQNSEGHVLMTAENPKLLMAKIAQVYFRPTSHLVAVGQSRIAETAVISETAKIGKDVIIGPGAIIGNECSIGDGAVIGALSVLEEGCIVGARTHIHPQVFLGHHTEIGEDSEIKPHSVIGGEGFGFATDMKKGEHHRITHFGRVRIGNHVHIGSGVQIDRGTFQDSRIEDQVKIDNLCHFGHNIEIGRGTIITGGVVTAGSAKIGKFCVIGGRTTIGGHLEIADFVQLGGLSAVTKSIPEKGQYGGHPVQPLSEYLKTQSSLRKVPELRKSLQKIMKALNLKED